MPAPRGSYKSAHTMGEFIPSPKGPVIVKAGDPNCVHHSIETPSGSNRFVCKFCGREVQYASDEYSDQDFKVSNGTYLDVIEGQHTSVYVR